MFLNGHVGAFRSDFTIRSIFESEEASLFGQAFDFPLRYLAIDVMVFAHSVKQVSLNHNFVSLRIIAPWPCDD